MQRKQSTRNGKKLETLPALKLEKVKSKKEAIKEAQKNNNKDHFASLIELRVSTTIPEVQREGCASRRL